MTLFYAPGTGWGHLYRTRQLVPQLAHGSFKVLTANTDAYRFFTRNEVEILPSNRKSAQDSLSAAITRFPVSEFIIDTFPLGLDHALPIHLFETCTVSYLARRLKWKDYARNHLVTPNIHFHKTYQLEDLEPEHSKFVSTYSDHVQSLDVPYQVSAPLKDTMNTSSPLWVIMHSTHVEEVEMLYNYACDYADLKRVKPYFLVLSDQTIPLDRQGTCICHIPADVWFSKADVIFTGGGFNSMHMMRNYKNKHVALPFPRRYDDQVWRINHMGANGLSPEPVQIMEKLSEA